MNESRATRYQRRRRRAQVWAALLAGLVLALVALTPAAVWLAGAARTFAEGLPPAPHAIVSLLLFVLMVVALAEAAALPALVYRVRRVDRVYRAETASSVEAAIGAHLQAAAVGLLGAWAASGVVFAAVRVAGAWWWVAAGAALALALAAMLRLGPLVLARLASIRPLSRAELGETVTELARRVRVPVAGIDEWVVAKGTPATALVTGVGRSRRVLLSSEIARSWADDEIAVIVAHELAHLAYHDLWRAFAVNVAVLCGGLWAADLAVRLAPSWLAGGGPGDLPALPLVALVTAGVWALATPLRHAQSRRHERRADLFALEATGGAEAFGAAVRRLSLQRLAEERPSTLTLWLHHRHPSVAERLAIAEAHGRTKT